MNEWTGASNPGATCKCTQTERENSEGYTTVLSTSKPGQLYQNLTEGLNCLKCTLNGTMENHADYYTLYM